MIQGITDRATFDHIRKDGHQVRSRDLRVRYVLDATGTAGPRVAYALTRKVGSAVTRNRIRRRIRGVLNEILANGENLPEAAMLFIAHRSAAELDYEELRVQVTTMMKTIEKSRKSSV